MQVSTQSWPPKNAGTGLLLDQWGFLLADELGKVAYIEIVTQSNKMRIIITHFRVLNSMRVGTPI